MDKITPVNIVTLKSVKECKVGDCFLLNSHPADVYMVVDGPEIVNNTVCAVVLNNGRMARINKFENVIPLRTELKYWEGVQEE